MKPRILITCAQMQGDLPAHRANLERPGYEIVAPPLSGQYFTAGQLTPMMPGVVGVIAGDDQLDRSFFEAAGDLRVLVRWGIGMDSVDHSAAADHGVVVRNTPGVFGAEVADSAMTYVLLLARGHHLVDRTVREGGWPKREGVSLAATTIGIVGFGDVGRAVADRAAGFGMAVRVFDPFIAQSGLPHGVLMDSRLEDLLGAARFVVLTCPLTPETFHLIDAAALAVMSPDAFLINVARGPVVDQDALVESLAAGRLAGAGLDVFEIEPLPAGSPLVGFDNVVLGAHNGSNTREGVARASKRAVEILLEELEGD